MDSQRVICPSCGQPNPRGKRFCGDCGAPLPAVCPACGSPNPPDKRFCGDCGGPLTPAAASARPSARAATPPPDLQGQFDAFQQALPASVRPQIFAQEEGENRLLTILFADLSGSTAIVGAFAPEDAATLLHRVLQAMVDAVVAHGGRINQVLGDALLAFFGTPLAHENDPERAIRAALQIREAVQGRGLQMTAGINSGEVYLGELGRGPRQDVRAVGSPINLAARLQQKARPGQILVGESVYWPTHRAFAFARREVQAKGFAEPVVAYEVLEALPHPEKVRGIEGLRASLVGRDAELTKLREALAAVRAGQGQIVTLIGEAGVGKSRLVAELKELALAPTTDQPTPLWLEGRSLDIGMAVSYWPFLDLLQTHVAVTPEDDESTRGERIMAALQELVAYDALTPQRSQQMLPLLGHLLAARFNSELDERLRGASPAQLQHQTFLALRDLCVALARRQPLILVLEDLHWADSLSLDLVSLLMEALTLGPILLLCVYRPEREHRCWHLGAIAQRKCPERHTELTVRELTPAQSRRLVESLLHIEALPPTVKEQILARAQGNPFFVEEVVRSLIDTGLVYHDGTVWRAREEIAAVAVPESVQSVILSRVDRLEAQTRHVLQSAAVIGRLFRRRLLEHLAQQETALDRALAELEDRQLIYAERVVPEEEYSFQHVLTQETVYQNILRRQRAVYHRQVAEVLEGLYAESLEEYYEQLAYHYEQAGVQEKALAYLERAGDKAQAHYANAVAEGYYGDLVTRLDTLGRPLDAARVREKLGAVLATVARFDAALLVLEQAAASYQAAGDVEGQRRTVARLGGVHCGRMTAEEGLERVQALLPSLEAGVPSPGLAALYVAHGRLLEATNQLTAGLAAFERAADLARLVHDDQTLAAAEVQRGNTLFWHGHSEEALSVLERAIPLTEAARLHGTLLDALIILALLYDDRGEFDRSRQYIEQFLAGAERIGDPPALAVGLAARGRLAFHAGDWARARVDFEQALAMDRHFGTSWASQWIVAFLAQLCLAEGAWDEAARYLEDVGTAFNPQIVHVRAQLDLRVGRPEAMQARLVPLKESGYYVAASLPIQAEAYLALGEVAEAERVAAEAITRAQVAQMRLMVVEGLRVQALVAIRQEHWDVAAQALEEGVALARSMPYPFAEARLLHVYGELHLQKGEPDLARERLEAALAILRRLGARKDVDEVGRALADLT